MNMDNLVLLHGSVLLVVFCCAWNVGGAVINDFQRQLEDLVKNALKSNEFQVIWK